MWTSLYIEIVPGHIHASKGNSFSHTFSWWAVKCIQYAYEGKSVCKDHVQLLMAQLSGLAWNKENKEKNLMVVVQRTYFRFFCAINFFMWNIVAINLVQWSQTMTDYSQYCIVTQKWLLQSHNKNIKYYKYIKIRWYTFSRVHLHLNYYIVKLTILNHKFNNVFQLASFSSVLRLQYFKWFCFFNPFLCF